MSYYCDYGRKRAKDFDVNCKSSPSIEGQSVID